MAVQARTMSIQENLGFSLRQDLLAMDDAAASGGGFNDLHLLQQHKPLNTMMMIDQPSPSLPYVKNNQSNTFGGNSNGSSIVGYDDHLRSTSSFIHKQRIDLDQLLRLQEERLRHALQEQGKQQLSNLINRYESKASPLIQEKDEEISKASKRKAQMQEYISRMEMERLKWQRLAKEKELAVESLKKAIEKLREDAPPPCLSENAAAGDAQSCCDQENGRMTMVCKICKNRSSCVVFLPCRHLCSCKDCEAWLDSCPVCKEEKKATIDALF